MKIFKKRYLFLLAATIFLFSSCLTTKSAGKSGKKPSGTTSASGSGYQREYIDTSVWNLKTLDTARNVSYLTELEKDIILETNMARSNPKKYSEMYIEPRLKKFEGKIYLASYGRIKTKEGTKVVKETIRFMKKQKPVPILAPSQGLTKAAKDHAVSQSKTKQTGHTGTDGSTPSKRIKRYGTYRAMGENITYGVPTAREIVANLIIDDAVRDRGHRKNMYIKDFDCVGASFVNQHKVYGSVCVMDYAGQYKEK